MASIPTTLLRTIFSFTKPWRPFFSPSFFSSRNPCPAGGCKIFKARNHHRLLLSRKTHNFNYSDEEATAPSSSPDDCEPDPDPPQEAVLKAISVASAYMRDFVRAFASKDLNIDGVAEVSKAEGRVGQTTNVVIGGTTHDDSTNEWLVLDKKVNSYPTERVFTAIGTGGDEFVQAMVVAVESVIQESIIQGQVKKKDSSGGKYVSVNIGPILVINSEQVRAVYNAMRRDERVKYFL
ncbi:hypothetical protein DM860_013695 [Cuscuta australis]|uniref:Uncharacterized protein n=1 Tax=Cuscuta australis TaxID=267555 RepID=A0A328EEI0_9ASTE|nr:hypothetical protein DM860_013695 [Cuscuta australis]